MQNVTEPLVIPQKIESNAKKTLALEVWQEVCAFSRGISEFSDGDFASSTITALPAGSNTSSWRETVICASPSSQSIASGWTTSILNAMSLISICEWKGLSKVEWSR